MGTFKIGDMAVFTFNSDTKDMTIGKAYYVLKCYDDDDENMETIVFVDDVGDTAIRFSYKFEKQKPTDSLPEDLFTI